MSPPAEPNRTIVVLAAHGSRADAANEAHRVLAADLARRSGTDVVPAFLELEDPDIGSAVDLSVEAGAATVRVLPFFLHPGRHLSEDVPRIVADAASRHPRVTVELMDYFGGDPGVVEILSAAITR